MKYTYLFFLWLFFAGLFVSCQEDDLNSTSIFDVIWRLKRMHLISG